MLSSPKGQPFASMAKQRVTDASEIPKDVRLSLQREHVTLTPFVSVPRGPGSMTFATSHSTVRLFFRFISPKNGYSRLGISDPIGA
jgi:hypothetical protein